MIRGVSLEFGTGAINIVMGGMEGNGTLMFEQKQPGRIGNPTLAKELTYIDPDDYPVSMMFSNVESIDAFIYALQAIRKVVIGEINIETRKTNDC